MEILSTDVGQVNQVCPDTQVTQSSLIITPETTHEQKHAIAAKLAELLDGKFVVEFQPTTSYSDTKDGEGHQWIIYPVGDYSWLNEMWIDDRDLFDEELASSYFEGDMLEALAEALSDFGFRFVKIANELHRENLTRQGLNFDDESHEGQPSGLFQVVAATTEDEAREVMFGPMSHRIAVAAVESFNKAAEEAGVTSRAEVVPVPEPEPETITLYRVIAVHQDGSRRAVKSFLEKGPANSYFESWRRLNEIHEGDPVGVLETVTATVTSVEEGGAA